MEAIPYLALISAVAALGLAVYYYRLVEAAPAGNDRMVFLMTEIQKGARAFLKAEYTWVSVFVVAYDVLSSADVSSVASCSVAAPLAVHALFVGVPSGRPYCCAKAGTARNTTIAAASVLLSVERLTGSPPRAGAWHR